MRQEDIVNEVRNKCGNVRELPLMGWHFIFNKRHYFYLLSDNGQILRFCIPHLLNSSEYNWGRLVNAVNETNKDVKFIKCILQATGSVSVEYDHKMTLEADLSEIVPHIIDLLDFAANYLKYKLDKEPNL